MNKSMLWRLMGGLACWAAAAYVAADMQALYQREELWGWRPLFLELLVWGGLLSLVGLHITRLPERAALLGASSLSGVLLWLGFMPMPLAPALLVGWLPLLWAEERVARARPGRSSKWTVFKLAFNAFLIWNILTTFWVCNAGLIAGLIANSLNAFFMAVVFVFYHVFKRYHDPKLFGWILISVWLAFEWGHQRWDISWSWLTLGNGLAHMPALVQWYEITGWSGGSLWILGVNLLLFRRLQSLPEQARSWRSPAFWRSMLLWQPLALLLAPVALSLGMYWTYHEDKSRSVEVVSVQPNFEPHFEKFTLLGDDQLQHFLALSAPQLTPQTDYLLFPETSFSTYRIGEPQPKYNFIDPLREFIRPYPKLNLITGVTSGQNYAPEKAPPTAYRVDCTRLPNGELAGCKYREYHNAAIQINNQTDSIPLYKKSKLVIGAETLPLIGDVEWLRGWIMELGGIQGVGLGTQPRRDVFASASGSVAPVICYESIFGEYVTEYVKRGAQALFVLTNDGWWDNTPGHVQHLHFSRLRAIETRRPVVRSANTGISAFIDSRGDLLQSSRYDQAIALRGTVYLQNDITFYVRYGDLIARIAGFLFFMWWLSTLSKWIQGSLKAKGKTG